MYKGITDHLHALGITIYCNEKILRNLNLSSFHPLITFYHQIHQLHFHWGADSTMGSEHHLDGKTYASEVNILLYLPW